MNLRRYKTVQERRSALEASTNVKLPHIGSYSIDDTVASAYNCENMIGAAQIPLGVAGPLIISNIRNKKEKESHYIPLATTEGALVASINRGCKAVTQSGGAVVDSYRVGATRGAVFKISGIQENDRLNAFLEEHFVKFQERAAQASHHLVLKRFLSRGIGKYRYIRFVYDTQDAMGMNMASIATDTVCRWIEQETGARLISLAGNFDVDKKPAWLNIIQGRGIKVWGEARISERVLSSVLKTTAGAVYEVWLAKCMLGSAISGSMAYNSHFANIAAAVFLATGQDPAHIVEAGLGITTVEVQGEDLYVSVHLPDLMVGTVGGGTTLETQKEALSLLGITGGDKGRSSQRLAEIIGATVLAGELSLLASLSEGSLVRAHQQLARGKRNSI